MAVLCMPIKKLTVIFMFVATTTAAPTTTAVPTSKFHLQLNANNNLT